MYYMLLILVKLMYYMLLIKYTQYTEGFGVQIRLRLIKPNLWAQSFHPVCLEYLWHGTLETVRNIETVIQGFQYFNSFNQKGLVLLESDMWHNLFCLHESDMWHFFYYIDPMYTTTKYCTQYWLVECFPHITTTATKEDLQIFKIIQWNRICVRCESNSISYQ